jgi:hypothetical protein
MEAASIVLALGDDMVWFKATKAAATEVPFKGLDGSSALRRRLAGIDFARRGRKGGVAPSAPGQDLLPFR